LAGPYKLPGGGICYICSSEEIGNFKAMAEYHQEERELEHYSLERQHEQAVDILSNEKIGE
jgi:hypothetical protein